MAEEQITYEELPPDHKKKYDELKAICEAELIGSFEKTRSHGVRNVPKPCDRDQLCGGPFTASALETVNTLERVALRVVQEIMERRYSPSGPVLGTHQGEMQLHTRPPLPYTMAAPQQQGSPAYVVYKDGDQRSLRDQFGILPKKKIIGYSKPYPNEFDLIPLPPKYRLPDFNKFSGTEGASSIEHVSRYLAQLGMASASDQLRVRCFSLLTGPAFGWYTSLQPNSVQSWKQLEELFHTQYHSRLLKLVLPN
ncbi:hypothetical protein QYE76_015576 [Lolium multiflorum]|uniref:Retrotransposon gag domain-containing protein n=1 Tax=Lolium multiflorum TaxID=4521 RepID=A0AAD8U8D3_LOLMU|nr:hypothetical protein QYE76_015576 [Lolium multiflorum]